MYGIFFYKVCGPFWNYFLGELKNYTVNLMIYVELEQQKGITLIISKFVSHIRISLKWREELLYNGLKSRSKNIAFSLNYSKFCRLNSRKWYKLYTCIYMYKRICTYLYFREYFETFRCELFSRSIASSNVWNLCLFFGGKRDNIFLSPLDIG